MMKIDLEEKVEEGDNSNMRRKRPRLVSMLGVLILMCGMVISQGMVVSGQLPISLAIIERAYGYNSTQSGFIHSTYDVIFALGAIIFGYFFHRRKMTSLAVGSLFICFGCLVFTIPAFLTWDKVEITINNQKKYLCSTRNITSRDDTCVPKSFLYLVLFCIGYGLVGWGAAPLHTLGVTYFEENLPPTQSGMYLGIFYLCAAIGPAIGFALGKPFLTLPVNLKYDNDSIITSSSESWIGAWWLGYILAAFLLLFLAIMMFLFPDQKVTAKKTFDSRNESTSASNLLQSMKRVFSIVPFDLMILAMSVEGIAVNGMGTFLSKYIEVQLRVTSANASLYSGILAVLGAGSGCLLGGLFLKYKTVSVRKLGFVVAGASSITCITLVALLLGSQTRSVNNQLAGHFPTCDISCYCSSLKYEPVCYKDKSITYYSPCAVGCRNLSKKNNDFVFSDCSCLHPDASLYVGACSSTEKLKTALFITVAFFLFFGLFLTYVPSITFLLKVLEGEPRNLGIGMQQVFTRVGFIIGPVVYGKLIDTSCLIWQKDDCGNASNCSEYDNSRMRLIIFLTTFFIKIFSSSMYFLAGYIFKPSTAAESPNSKKNSLPMLSVTDPMLVEHIRT